MPFKNLNDIVRAGLTCSRLHKSLQCLRILSPNFFNLSVIFLAKGIELIWASCVVRRWEEDHWEHAGTIPVLSQDEENSFSFILNPAQAVSWFHLRSNAHQLFRNHKNECCHEFHINKLHEFRMDVTAFLIQSHKSHTHSLKNKKKQEKKGENREKILRKTLVEHFNDCMFNKDHKRKVSLEIKTNNTKYWHPCQNDLG